MAIKKICLVTSGQPSTNPRVVQSADALCEAGYRVHVIASYWAAWAAAADKTLMANRKWTFECAGGTPGTAKIRYYRTRLRHKAARVPAFWLPGVAALEDAAIGRATADLERAAVRNPADLYIAHYLPGLVAASKAAARHGARFGFDAEDFHSGQLSADPGSPEARWAAGVEKRYIPGCDFVTASSPEIAGTYRDLCGLAAVPAVLLNVFPLALGPQEPPLPAGRGPLTLFWFSQTIGEGRGLEDVIRAMARLCGAAELHIAGRFFPGYRERLSALVESEGVDPSCVVPHGIVPPEDLARFSAGWDVGLAAETSNDRNRQLVLSNKLFTYLLAGNAVAATSTSAQASIAATLGEAVWLYAPGDPSGLAEGLRRWMSDPEALARSRRAARAAAEKIYNWDREKEKLLALVKGLG